jgi:hypothetical protein
MDKNRKAAALDAARSALEAAVDPIRQAWNASQAAHSRIPSRAFYALLETVECLADELANERIEVSAEDVPWVRS